MAGTFLVGQATNLLLDHISDAGEVRGFVLDISPREVILAFPGLTAPPPGFLPGRPVTVRFWSQLGVHNASSTIVRYGVGPQVSLVIERFQKFETIQQRRYFRVIVSLPVTFDVLSGGLSEAHGRQRVQAFSRDLSAGGLSMETSMHLVVGDRLKITVSPPRSLLRTIPAALSVEAHVVRSQEVQRGPKTVHHIGIEYDFPSEGERDRWVGLTFHLQRGVKY